MTPELAGLLRDVGGAAIAAYEEGRAQGACRSSATNAMAAGQAAIEALDRELGPDHVLVLVEHGYTLEHPLLACRIRGGDMSRCPFGLAAGYLCQDGPPVPPGRYPVRLVDGYLCRLDGKGWSE